MNGMQNMYNASYPDPGSQAIGSYAQNDGLEGLADGSINPHMIASGPSQTLDQIISQNNQEMMRRRQTFHSRFQDPSASQNRRASMLEFSSSNNGDLADFQFDPNPQHATLPSQIANMNMSPSKPLDPRRVRSREELMIDTRFSQVPPYDGGPMSAFPASMIPNSGMNMDGSNSFIQQNLDMSGDYDPMSATDLGPLHLTTDSVQQPMYTTSPIAASFPMHFPNSNHDPGGSVNPANNQALRVAQGSGSQHGSSPQRFFGKSQNQIRRNPMMPSPLSLSTQNSMSSGHMQSPIHNSHVPHVPPNSTAAQHQPRSRRASIDMQPAYLGQESEVGMDMNNINNMNDLNNGIPNGYNPKWANAYSTTGFDMLAILMRVASRRNPQINLGPVDLACAFVVCDIEKHDLPIVYCSDMFERLTGYSRHEILGRNCRFLQAPDGKVQSGIKRKYVDDKSVLYLKNQISKRTEAQISLINYRKGGQPFMNLLTMIPITWDNEEFKYFVGFQVDLVEQPNSVSARNPDGTYEINYNRSALPAYRLPAPDPASALDNMGGATISRDEVSQVLTTIGNGETDLSRRIWDKVLLENTDDVVHVLSLKGLFLYLSPACQQVLEYDPSELVGTALSAVCHPSDIVPVTRELKESSNGSAVNVVYRIRRKNSGYTWFEAHGSLHTEQGKGRKCIILVGRQRPVYAIDKNDIEVSEGAGDAELWTKMSTTGMFLYVSSSARAMLDRLPEDLVGTSMQALMRQESKKEFGRILELARMGEKSTFKHDLQNRRGQVLQAQTTVYPGDAKKGFKPTFLLGQTRLLKMTRTMLLSQKSTTSAPRSDVSMGASTPHSASGMPNPATPSRHNSMVAMNQSTGKGAFIGSSGILTQAGSGGVPIGSQDELLASDENIFDELKTTRSTSWQFELRQMERQNRLLSEDLATLLARKKKRKRRKGMGNMEKDCANCHTRVTPEWRRGPSGQRDLCNSCGLRWAKQNGRVSPRKSIHSDKSSSPMHTSAGQQQQSGAITSIDTGTGPDQKVRKTSNEDIPATLKHEDTDDSLGNMPTVIEEGSEPPHSNVLPT